MTGLKVWTLLPVLLLLLTSHPSHSQPLGIQLSTGPSNCSLPQTPLPLALLLKAQIQIVNQFPSLESLLNKPKKLTTPQCSSPDLTLKTFLKAIF
jgi:hypothetical protein